MKRIRDLIDNVGLSAASNERPGGSQAIATAAAVAPASITNQPEVCIEPLLDEYFDSSAGRLCDLDHLPANASQELIQGLYERLQHHLASISKKLSSAILENQQSYNKELQRVRELQNTLKIAFSVCHLSKNHVEPSRNLRSLSLLVQIQRKHNLLNLRMALNSIKTLEHTDVHLRLLMEDGRYPDAIQLCLECGKVSTEYGHYNCIKDLSNKLQDTIELIEEQMDETLSKICDNFDENCYAKLQLGYKLMGKRQTATDQLLMHFTTCIHRSASQVLLHHMKSDSENVSNDLQKKTFLELCRVISSTEYIPSLLHLCKTLVNILWCYQQVLSWHSTDAATPPGVDVDTVHNYVIQKLDKGRQRIWIDVQSRIKQLLISAEISSFEYEQFIQVVSIVTTFISIGKKFCGTYSVKKATELEEPVYQLSLQYFQVYHRKCLDELHLFLTNEAWESCPVQSDFSVLHLPEFKPFHAAARRELLNVTSTSGEDEYCETNSGLTKSDTKLFDSVPHKDNNHPDGTILPVLTDRNATEDNSAYAQGLLLTNSALSILRICGRYLSMCEVLDSISMDVVICMSHLFDYYLISIYHLFVSEDCVKVEHSEKLCTTLDRIRRELISTTDSSTSSSPRLLLPTLSPIVDLLDRQRIFGFQNRIAAAESLSNLAKQLKELRPSLEKILPPSKRAFLQQFFAQTVDTCHEVKSLVYFAVPARMVDYDLILRQVVQVNWDIREIMSQHNKYIDDILLQLKFLQPTLLPIIGGLSSSNEIMKIIWKYCAIQCNQTFVEGYSYVKKCSNEGRALMQLDYQQFISKFEELSALSPAPGKSYVESYLKAFYLSEEDFESWREKHLEYSDKQLSSLLACITSAATSYSKKNKRHKVRAVFDDITRKK